ncbi:MAG: glycosyltransferase family 4 protein [Pseudomonadota bacterium]|nr:glycosyltransferase family 4 protein [Pseudomonadota bacterium]
MPPVDPSTAPPAAPERPLRILQIARVFWPNIGGIERHVQWLAEQLVRRGHVCDVVTLNRSFEDGSSYPAYDLHNGVHIWRVPFAGSTRYPLAPRVARFASRYDVVHVHAIDFMADWMVATKRWHKKPVVLSTHGGFFHTAFAPRLKKIWFQTATRAMLSGVDRLLYTSDQDEELFRTITDKGVILRNAVDLAPWEHLGAAPTPGAWVTIGRVDTHKGLSNLVKTLAAVRDRDPRPFVAEVLGPEVVPGLVAGLERERDALGLQGRLVFRGKVSQEDLVAAVDRADLGLFPSEYESFGISVVEAMGAGLVPVLNDIRAFRYFIDEGKNGFVTRYADPSAAAATILRARDLGERRAEVSAAARTKAQTYAWEHVVGDVEAVYRAVIAGR